MNTDVSAYGLWPLVVVNAAVIITRHSDHLVCLLVMWEKLCFRIPSLHAPKQGLEPLRLRRVSRCATRGVIPRVAQRDCSKQAELR